MAVSNKMWYNIYKGTKVVKQKMKTNVGIRMDEELKKQFEECCAQLELTMTSAVNLFARAVVRERRIPFDIRIDPPDDSAAEPENEGERA